MSCEMSLWEWWKANRLPQSQPQSVHKKFGEHVKVLERGFQRGSWLWWLSLQGEWELVQLEEQIPEKRGLNCCLLRYCWTLTNSLLGSNWVLQRCDLLHPSLCASTNAENQERANPFYLFLQCSDRNLGVSATISWGWQSAFWCIIFPPAFEISQDSLIPRLRRISWRAVSIADAVVWVPSYSCDRARP